MTCAYSELYLDLAQNRLGDMYDFAVNTLKYEIGKFHEMFLVSGMAHQFEMCNPTYVAGKNGCEIAKEVIETCTGEWPDVEDAMYMDKSEEYWIGWALAYYQWRSCTSFHEITETVPIDELYAMYPTYHEMDIEMFVETMDEHRAKRRDEMQLRRLRRYANLTQRALAEKADVPLRQIQLFEQGERDINKTQGQTLRQIAKALNCQMEDLLE